MIGHKAFLRAVAVLVCATAIFTVPARAQVGETFRIEAGKGLPHCEEDSASPLCVVETKLAFRIPEHRAAMGITVRENQPRPYTHRETVVVPAVIEYRIDSAQALDARAVQSRRSSGRDCGGLVDEGMFEVVVKARYRDHASVAWPPSGWLTKRFLLESGNRGWSLRCETGGSGINERISSRTATSNCIGDPATPFCAVETWLACRVRNDARLCDLVDDDKSTDERDWRGFFLYGAASMTAVSGTGADSGEPLAYTVVIEEIDDSVYSAGGGVSFIFTEFSLIQSETGWRVKSHVSGTWQPRRP